MFNGCQAFRPNNWFYLIARKIRIINIFYQRFFDGIGAGRERIDVCDGQLSLPSLVVYDESSWSAFQ